MWERDSAFENKPGGCQASQNSFVAANTAENAPEPYLFYIKIATSSEVCGPLGKDKATCESDARCEWDADTDDYVYYCSNDGAAYAKAMKGIKCPEGAGKTPTCPNGKDCVCTDLDLSCTGSDDWSYKRGGECGISGDKGVVVLHQFFYFYLFSEGPHGARLPCFWSQSLVRGVLPRSP